MNLMLLPYCTTLCGCCVRVYRLYCHYTYYPSYRKAHRKAVEAQKKHQKEIAQLEEELHEVQQAMSQFEGEGSSQEDDLQLMDSQVMRLTMCKDV